MTPGFLLDTNIISETRKTRPNSGVVDFMRAHPSRAFYLSVLTLGELRKGAARRRHLQPNLIDDLSQWIDEMETRFADRVLSIDAKVARLWAELSADRSRPVIDTLLVATAMRHDLTLVTRNTIDMGGTGTRLLDPFV